jgi:UTP--glucose-1-phosphate uridylyltransferase
LMLKHNNIIALAIEGKRYDIGNKLDFLKTTVEFALKRKEFKRPFEKFLREIIGKIDEQKGTKK